MSENTTSIHDLPVNPTGGGNNISLSANEMNVNSNANMNANMNANSNAGIALDQTTINHIVNGLQQASATGATLLPSRDIPQNQEGIVRDAQIQPTYIPPPQKVDYINHHEQNEDILNNYQKQMNQSNSLDTMYDELQTPILLCVLFFLFQLPFFKKYLFAYVPGLFLNDGNYNIYGFVFISILFALVYYILCKTTSVFTKI